jgi:DNA-binding response OmpR family regulator
VSFRILVLDESRVLPWVVERVCPKGTEVVCLTDFEEAGRAIKERQPDAVVASIPPAHLPWREFQHACANGCPPVPVLYVSCLHSSAGEVGLEPLEGDAVVLRKPATKAELEAALARLLASARESRASLS